MPVALLNSLPKISFSKNPIEVNLFSNDFLVTAGVKSVNTILFKAELVNNTQLAISYNGTSLTFIAKSFPDDSGYQFPTGHPTVEAGYAGIVLSYLAGNQTIDNDFDLELTSSGGFPGIKFTAKKDGPGYAFDVANVSTHQILNNVVGVNEELKPNFSHRLEVHIKKADGSGFDRIYNYNLFLDYPRTGKSGTDISDTLNSYLEFDKPDLSGSYWKLCPNSIREYHLKYAQVYGEDRVVKRLHKTEPLYVALGGYSNLALGQVKDNNHLASYLLPHESLFKFQRWFENFPVDDFKVKTNEPCFLYFVNSRSVAETLNIKLNLTFEDGSSQEVIKPGGLLKSIEKVCVGCGYLQLGLNAFSTGTKKVSGYTVQLVLASNGEPRSLVKSFTVNRNFEAYTRYFLYADGAGNFKTLRTFGSSQVTSETKTEQVKKQMKQSAIPTTGEFENQNITSVESGEVNSGYISSKDSYDSIKELIVSPMVFRVIGNSLIPVIITSKKFGYAADKTNLNAVKIEYQLAFEEQQYTADSYALNVPTLNRAQQSINDI